MERHAPKRFNNATLLHTAETGSDDWKFSRQFGIGGSEISTILGLNEYKSAYTLWAEKTGRVEPEPVDNWSVRFGRAFEQPILELWQEQHPEFEVYLTGTYSDNRLPYMQASPDALAKNKGTGEWFIVEIKTARYAWDKVPVGYRAQVMHYLDVMGLKGAFIVAVAGWNWFEKFVEFDQWEADNQRHALENFWAYVQDDRAPDYDGADSTYETVRKMHPDIDPDASVEIDGAHWLALAQDKFDDAKAELNLAKSAVLDAMGNARTAYVEHDGEKIIVATRQARGDAPPYLVVKKGKR